MKKISLFILTLSVVVMSCNNNSANKTASGSTMKFPYEAHYTTDFTNDVPDSSLLLVLNSYKYWENADFNALRATMGDSMYAYAANGMKFKGLADSVMPIWKQFRDSLSSINIRMDVWLKNHSVKDSIDYINVWYKEIDTYKTGKVDSAYYEDDNGLKNGKIIWYSSHKQILK